MIFKFSTTTIFSLALLLLTHVAHAIPHDAGELSTRSTETMLAAMVNIEYDNPKNSLNGVACSNGTNDLAARFPTFGDIPGFPYVCGMKGTVFNSPSFGGCYKLTNVVTNVSINVIVIDTAWYGIALGRRALTALSGGQIVGVLDVTVIVEEVDHSFCGL
jgi:Cerato-platanin